MEVKLQVTAAHVHGLSSREGRFGANLHTDEKKRKPLEHLLAYQRPDASSTHKQHEDDDIISSMRMIMHAYASLALLLQYEVIRNSNGSVVGQLYRASLDS
jgi:hypothetical protein